MPKKYTAILMFTAYAILLGHSIIPHHHHDTEHDLTEHCQTEHQHDGDKEDESLKYVLSHFIHSFDGFTTLNKHNITFSKQLVSIVAVLCGNFSLSSFTIPPLLYKPPAEHLIYISPHSLSSGLRAPPAFIA